MNSGQMLTSRFLPVPTASDKPIIDFETSLPSPPDPDSDTLKEEKRSHDKERAEEVGLCREGSETTGKEEDDGRLPTDEKRATLRLVAAPLPKIAWLNGATE